MSSELNLWQALWHASVIVKIVLAILVISSIYSWAIIWKKKNELELWEKHDQEFLKQFKEAAQLNHFYQHYPRSHVSPLQILFSVSHGEFLSFCEKMGSQEKIREHLLKHYTQFGFVSLERSLKKAMNECQNQFQSSLSHLATIGSLAPFVGLFGTVWGIIHAFNLLAGQGASLEVLAPGIAEALVTTAIGLGVAIPAVMFFNLFQQRIDMIQMKMESFGYDYLNRMEKTFL